MDDLLSPADAARLLGVVPATVRQMERDGRLPAQRTVGGMRLFRREDVERLRDARAAGQQAGPAVESHVDKEGTT
jgi:excisionase family DNA binding protein